MGGGDLNLKKSWHPSTLRNIERVWKAEQKHEQEQKKIEQLQRELAEERAREEMRQFAETHGVVKKKEERLDWMYQGPSALIDREQYLMGRAIDRTFEVIQEHEEGREKNAEASQPGALFNQSSVNVTVDLATKVREDPLFTIKKHQVEQKKRLLDNPIKMRQIQQMLAESMTSQTKKKKHKKHKKHHRNTEKNEDNKRKHGQEKERKMSHKSKLKEVHKRHKDARQDRDLTEPNRERVYFRSRKMDNNWSESRTRSQFPAKRKLSDEEMERRRREMMANATWREEQRLNNVKRYKAEERDESERSKGGSEASFIRPLLSKATVHGSVESRIKQNVYNIQRSKFDMDKSFVKR